MGRRGRGGGRRRGWGGGGKRRPVERTREVFVTATGVQRCCFIQVWNPRVRGGEGRWRGWGGAGSTSDGARGTKSFCTYALFTTSACAHFVISTQALSVFLGRRNAGLASWIELKYTFVIFAINF